MNTNPYDYLREHTISKSMKYHGASIENINCYWIPSIVTQSIVIYGHFKISPVGQSRI